MKTKMPRDPKEKGIQNGVLRFPYSVLTDSLDAVFDLYYARGKREESVKVMVEALKPLLHDSPTYSTLVGRLQEGERSNGTVNRYLALLSKAASYAQEQGLVDKLPKIRRLPEGQGRTRILTFIEEQELLKVASSELRPWIVFLVDTGLRTGEALSLSRAQVSKSSVNVLKSKNGRSRTVPLTPRASLAAQECLERRMTQARLSHLWDKARLKLGFASDKEFVPHMLRHTCASRLVTAGVSLSVVQRWLGHASIAMTVRYAHVGDQEVMNAVNALGSR